MTDQLTAADPIAVVDVERRYGTVAALHGLSLRVPAGAAMGLVGPNGAGKSTLLRLICGVTRPDAGTVRLAGLDPFRQPAGAKTSLGYVPELLPLFELLTGAEQLVWVGRLRGLPDSVIENRVRELSEVLDLASALDRRIAGYSKGMRQKLAFVAALVHDPRILVLDEPFDGVDVLAVRSMKGIIRQFVDAGAAVLLSSHILPLVEDVCDAFAIISEGRIVFQGDRVALASEAERVTEGSTGAGGRLEPVFWSVVAPGRPRRRLETVANPQREHGHVSHIGG
jgi:ABC-2 type transport system ATP-binding protein